MSVSARRPEQRRLKVFCVLSFRSTQKTFLLKGDCVTLGKFCCNLSLFGVKHFCTHLNIIKITINNKHISINVHLLHANTTSPIPATDFRQELRLQKSERANKLGRGERFYGSEGSTSLNASGLLSSRRSKQANGSHIRGCPRSLHVKVT